MAFGVYELSRTSGAIHGGTAALPEAILVMTFVITSKVKNLLWPDSSSWLHGNSTLRRCLLCSIIKAFFASSSSASWHASFSTDFSHGCHVAFAGLDDIYLQTLDIFFWRANFSASLLVWRTAHFDACLAAL